VERALAAIPPPFQEALSEVAVVIADEPSTTQLVENGLAPDDTLYGLYEGTPRTEYGADWVAVPNKITVFRLPLEQDFPDPDSLEDEVRLTVIHELAHHLGIGEDRLADLGLD
jgi:predicted Zn-dependent protease with MMP-like domain